jgi:GSH-dependent disulfide-bond oxidoreductase
MIDVHFAASPNGHKVTIMLEEIGLPYRLIRYNVFEGDQHKPGFRAINPNGRIPAIVDTEPQDGGGPLAVFESGAILIYLAEKSGALMPSSFRRRHAAMQWLMWQMAGLGPMHGQAHHFVRYCPEENPYALARYRNEAARLLDVLEARLSEAEFLAEEYSVADIACWPWVRAGRLIGVEVGERPNLARWFEAIAARPAVTHGAALPADSVMLGPAMQKTPLSAEQWSVLFGERLLAAARRPPR